MVCSTRSCCPHTRPAVDAVRALLQADLPLIERALRAAGQEPGSDSRDLMRWASSVQCGMQLLLMASEPLTTSGTVRITERLSMALLLLQDVMTLRLSPLDVGRVPVVTPPREPVVVPMPVAHAMIQSTLVGVLAALHTGASLVTIVLDTAPLDVEYGYPEGIAWRVVADAPGVVAPLLLDTWQEMVAFMNSFQGTLTSERTRYEAQGEARYIWEQRFWVPAIGGVQAGGRRADAAA